MNNIEKLIALLAGDFLNTLGHHIQEISHDLATSKQSKQQIAQRLNALAQACSAKTATIGASTQDTCPDSTPALH